MSARDHVTRLMEQARDTVAPLYVERRVLNPQALVGWLDSVGYPAKLRGDPSEFHVTLVYSRTPVNWNARKPLTNRVRVGSEQRRTETFGEANVLLVHSPVLHMEHRQFRDIGASWDFPSYQPHITVGSGWNRWKNLEPFDGTLILGGQRFAALED